MPEPIEIDRSALLELARGSNLYADALASLRELVSNAIDATLVRVFLEGRAPPTDMHSLDRLREVLDEFPIDVWLEALGDDASGAVRFHLRDRGTGIHEDDLPFIGVLGASSKNPHRRAAIEAMPEWMRPTGTFGIGLYSAFLSTDTLTLRTRALGSGETRVLIFSQAGEGVNLEVRRAAPEEALDGIGTEAVFDVRYSAVWEATRDIARWSALGFDPLTDALPDAALGAVRASLTDLALGGLVPLRIEGRSTEDVFRGRASFDPHTGVELARLDELGVTWTERESLPSHHFYRGAKGPVFHPQLPIRLAINVHFGTARMLSVARETVAHGERDAIDERIREAFRRIGRRWLDPRSGETAPENAWPWISRALWLTDGAGEASDPEEHWRRAEVLTVGEHAITLGEVAREPHIDVSTTDYRVSIPRYGLRDAVVNEGFRRDLARIFPSRRMLTSGLVRIGHETGATREATADLVSAFRSGVSRVLLPCPDGHRALAISGSGPLADRVATPGYEGDCVLLLPYRSMKRVITVPRIAEWVRLIAAHTIDGPVLPETLALPTLRFLVDFDGDVRARAPEGERALTIDYDLITLRDALVAAFGPLPSIESVRASLDGAR